MSATTVANLAAELPFFDVPDMTAGRSLYQEFTGRDLRALGFDAPLYSPAEAGAILARNLAGYDFLLYEYFRTDKVGHAGRPRGGRGRAGASRCASSPRSWPAGRPTRCSYSAPTTAISRITRSRPTPAIPSRCMAWGPGAERFVGGITRLDQVTPAIVALLT